VENPVPFEQHQEKTYSKDARTLYQAALTAIEKLGGSMVSSAPDTLRIEVKFPKTMLGKTLGERTYLACEIRDQGESSLAVVDAYPLDAVERKLMFGARKGVTQTVVTWFMQHLDQQLT
jgi:hypothetical protein